MIALPDQAVDVVDPHSGTIGLLQSAARQKTTGGDAKYHRLKERLILVIERTVNEYANACRRCH